MEGAPADQPGGEAPPGGGSPFGGIGMMLIMFLPMILIIFFLNRSQTKKQRDLESKLKKGDRVITSGGMVGRIADISSSSRYVKLEITSGVKIEVLKTAIQGLDTGDVAAVSSKEASDKGDKGDKNKK